jgi:hypothetical protein
MNRILVKTYNVNIGEGLTKDYIRFTWLIIYAISRSVRKIEYYNRSLIKKPIYLIIIKI